MTISKHWLNDELFVYAIQDEDLREPLPAAVDLYVGRKFYGEKVYIMGLPTVPEDLDEYIEELDNKGVFDEASEHLMSLL